MDSWMGRGAVVVSLMAAACSSGRAAPVPPEASAVPSSAAAAPSAPSSSAPSAPAGPSPEQLRAEAIAAAKSCTAPDVSIVNFPAEGKVFNNAQTRKEAGNVDRMQGIVDVVFGASLQLACCIDAGMAETDEATIMVTWEVAASGDPGQVRVLADRSTLTHDVTNGCLAEVIGELSFPEAPKGKATTVEIPLRARRDAEHRTTSGSG